MKLSSSFFNRRPFIWQKFFLYSLPICWPCPFPGSLESANFRVKPSIYFSSEKRKSDEDLIRRNEVIVGKKIEFVNFSQAGQLSDPSLLRQLGERARGYSHQQRRSVTKNPVTNQAQTLEKSGGSLRIKNVPLRLKGKRVFV